MKKIALIVLALFLVLTNVRAAYFEKLPYTITQPNGKTIACFVTGDEFYNWIHDSEGYTIIQAPNGYYYYAEKIGETLQPSKYLVDSIDPGSVGLVKWVKISKLEYKRKQISMLRYKSPGYGGPAYAPQSGTMNNIVVYIRFLDDAEFTTTRGDYDNTFNPSTGISVKSYFKEVSYNKLTINSTQYPACDFTTNLSYQDSHPRNYFQPYNETTNPNGYKDGDDGGERELREHQLLADAITWINLNSPVSPSLNIDGDDDGNVDNVCFLIKGSSGGWANLLWAHRWSLYSKTVYINTKRVYGYTFQPENQVGVRTLCHEMFHSLGSPDLYHYTDQGVISPVGYWDLMEYGSGHMMAYMKWKYTNNNWISSIPEITTTGNYSLNPLTSSTNNCYKIASPNSADEYFVVEYRNQSGTFESNIPGSGLIVYRIDTRENGNANGPPDEVYVYRPGGTPTKNGMHNDAFFSSTVGRTAINDTTDPNSFLQDGSDGGLDISDVTVAGSTISFKVTFCTPPSSQSTDFASSSFTNTSMTASWTRGNGDGVLVVARQGSAVDADPINIGAYTADAAFGAGTQLGTGNYVVYNGTGTSANITGLSPGTTYYYSIYEYTASCYLKPALTGNATTTGSCFAGASTSEIIGEYISNVSIGSINQASGRGIGGYEDYTSQIATLQVGANTSAVISVANSYNFDQILVWVDWNQDGDFTDAGENVYKSSGSNFSSPHTTANFSPPAEAKTGRTLMRIRLHDTSNGTNSTPCGNSVWGEVEDYSISVKAACSAPTLQATSFTSSAVSNNSMTVGWTRGNGNAVIVLARRGKAVNAEPVNEEIYSANACFGIGTKIGIDNYVVYNGIGTSVNVTAISPGTTYYYAVYEYYSDTYCYKRPELTGNITTTGIPFCVAGCFAKEYEYISNVSIGSINQSSDRGIDGYEDYTSQIANLQIGVNTSAIISVTNSFKSDQILVWVDWNNDCDFTDTGENVYTSSGSDFNSPHTTANFSPPADAKIGTTRMRIRLHDSIDGANTTPCENSAWGEVEDYTINVIAACTQPAAPTIGTISQTTCFVATGSVVLNGLPANETWSLTRTPGGAITTGTGISSIITGLSAGTYTYTVTNAVGCISVASANIVINSQPETPAAPTVGTITQPTCAVATGSVVLNGLPATGTWTLTRTPGAIPTTGTGISSTITGLAAGSYTYTVTNAAGCISAVSANVVINTQPSAPLAPKIGTITQPTCSVKGSVALSGLPATGTWTLTKLPNGTTSDGTGANTVITGLEAGSYTFKVTTSFECTSLVSSILVIKPQPVTPEAPTIGAITQPTCILATGSVVLNGLPATGTWTLTRSQGAIATTGTGISKTISGLVAGTYTYTVKNAVGCTSVASGNVVINTQPATPKAPVVGTITQPTCTVVTGSVILNGLPGTGTWTLTRTPGAIVTTGTGVSTTISDLAVGTYTYKVFEEVSGCTSVASASVAIKTPTTVQTPPKVGAITQPTCTVATGSVALSGLPSTGTWTLTKLPGGATSTGTGATKLVTGLEAGSYTFKVTNSIECTSVASGSVVIKPQPVTPDAPSVGDITHPICTLATGSVVLNGLPATGTWTLTRSQGAIATTGTGISKTISGLVAGTYTYTVKNAVGCTSVASGNVVINTQPATPKAPVVGTITQPTCTVSTGSVVLNGLPGTGTWTLTRTPVGTILTGTGISTTISELAVGTYTYKVTDGVSGCTSVASASVAIKTPTTVQTPPKVGTITQPTCTVSTGSVALSGLPSTGTWILTKLPGGATSTGTGATKLVTGLEAGTYTFKVTNSIECTSVASGSVVIKPQPVTPDAPTVGNITHPTCTVSTGSVVLSGLPAGQWTVTRTPGGINTTGSASSVTITLIPAGTYTYTVKNSVGCISTATGSVVINAQPLTPKAPVVGLITHPTCTVSTGSVVLSGLPVSSTWTLVRTPGAVTNTGTGVSATISGIPAGTFTYKVINADGCTSAASGSVVIKPQPATPTAPIVGTITQPTATVATGGVVLSGLPASGSWTLTRLPDAIKTTGTGTSKTITGLAAGTYTYTVTNSVACISAESVEVVIVPFVALKAGQSVLKEGSLVLDGAESSKKTPIAIDPIIDNEDVTIYPNPTKGLVYLKFTNIPKIGTWITLFDLSGKVISKSEAKNLEESINLDGYPAGLYFIRINQNPPKTFKIILE